MTARRSRTRLSASGRQSCVEAVAAGYPVQQVAAALRVSPETIRRWCRTAGHRVYAAYTAPQVRRLVERVRSGEAITRVAIDEGVPYATAHTWCCRAGVRSTHRPVAARRRPLAAA